MSSTVTCVSLKRAGPLAELRRRRSRRDFGWRSWRPSRRPQREGRAWPRGAGGHGRRSELARQRPAAASRRREPGRGGGTLAAAVGSGCAGRRNGGGRRRRLGNDGARPAARWAWPTARCRMGGAARCIGVTAATCSSARRCACAASRASRIWRTRLSFSTRRRVSSVRWRARCFLIRSLGALVLGLAGQQRLGLGALLLGLLDQAPCLLRQPCVLVRRPHVLGLAPGAGQHVRLVGLALLGGRRAAVGGFAPGFGGLARGLRLLRGGALLGFRRLALGVLLGRLGFSLSCCLASAGLPLASASVLAANFSAILCAASLACAVRPASAPPPST